MSPRYTTHRTTTKGTYDIRKDGQTVAYVVALTGGGWGVFAPGADEGNCFDTFDSAKAWVRTHF